MSPIELHSQRARLDTLFSRAREFEDTELQSHWSRYLCVLVSGFLENAVRLTYSEYCRQRADPLVADYAASRLQRFQNPSMGAILDLTGHFSKKWKEDLEASTQGQLKDSVDSIVSNRHAIAHGKSVSLSLVTLTRYYKDALRVIDLMQDQCGTSVR